ncbi:hypothetical protein J25TS5_21460 [Paenibacillus faecis]|uniref:Spore coat protein n=1 Tax=Paenibacillus faecis TaxID=862114 RepID=A0A5D0CTS7_9BACL|nr:MULTISPECIES: hypothetical protein [Paenibacillus]MCA1295148.1 hypothetical protein [Paenibacillus sp. alder61]TYA13040.1 hypothetical protein FRY98_10165 [Paenibacillus faecis]GIO85214.1 hypothetical protein J25TS5_21460 [Paenibacillus faecis]
MSYALHETLEVHELAAFKTVCMTKSKTMRGLVSDEELKRILQEDADVSARQLEELEAVLKRAVQ